MHKLRRLHGVRRPCGRRRLDNSWLCHGQPRRRGLRQRRGLWRFFGFRRRHGSCFRRALRCKKMPPEVLSKCPGFKAQKRPTTTQNVLEYPFRKGRRASSFRKRKQRGACPCSCNAALRREHGGPEVDCFGNRPKGDAQCRKRRDVGSPCTQIGGKWSCRLPRPDYPKLLDSGRMLQHRKINPCAEVSGVRNRSFARRHALTLLRRANVPLGAKLSSLVTGRP